MIDGQSEIVQIAGGWVNRRSSACQEEPKKDHQ
jgi:hypothetical protein